MSQNKTGRLAFKRRDRLRPVSVILIVACSAWAFAAHANEPCSGAKGGISRCRGETFICNDGSVSGSKRSCPAYLNGRVGVQARATSSMEFAPSSDDACSCQQGIYCIGPKGGRYCLTDSGTKSYLRK